MYYSQSKETLISSYAYKQAPSLHHFLNHTYKNILSFARKVLMLQEKCDFIFVYKHLQTVYFQAK